MGGDCPEEGYGQKPAIAFSCDCRLKRAMLSILKKLMLWVAALWVALAIAAAGGFIAGFLIGRKRYKS